MNAAPPGTNVPSRVCVIIPSVNNAEELGVALDGLAEQSYTDMEVVVVGPAGDPAIQLCKVRGVRFVDDGGSRNRADACNVEFRKLILIWFSLLMTTSLSQRTGWRN